MRYLVTHKSLDRTNVIVFDSMGWPRKPIALDIETIEERRPTMRDKEFRIAFAYRDKDASLVPLHQAMNACANIDKHVRISYDGKVCEAGSYYIMSILMGTLIIRLFNPTTFKSDE